MKPNPKIAFFGGEPLGVPVLKELKKTGILPELIVCNPDRPSGRGMNLTRPPVKVWAEENNIEVFQPISYQEKEALNSLLEQEWDLFVVVAYNFILPKWLLDVPSNGVINVHPSLLPSLRGASPIRTAIMEDLREDIGVTIMLMDEKMDHGPILDQMIMSIADKYWPISGPELDEALANMGGALLADVIPAWLDGNIEPQEQEHEAATYTKRLTKDQSEIQLDPINLPTGDVAWETLLKIKAFTGIGDTFFVYLGKRVKIKDAVLTDGDQLKILSVIPEGKKEMSFESYLQSLTS